MKNQPNKQAKKIIPCSLHSTPRARTRRLPSGCKWWRCSTGSCTPANTQGTSCSQHVDLNNTLEFICQLVPPRSRPSGPGECTSCPVGFSYVTFLRPLRCGRGTFTEIHVFWIWKMTPERRKIQKWEYWQKKKKKKIK